MDRPWDARDVAPLVRGKRTLLVVLGGSSGTSLLTRTLALCGAELPSGLLGATPSSPEGFWEPRAVICLNEAILRYFGSSGYDLALRVWPNDRIDAKSKAFWVGKITDYLATLPESPLVVLKEPKITMVFELWRDAARAAGFEVVAVLAVRHPQEFIASLSERASHQNYVQNSPELGSAWWLKYMLIAERSTRDVPRVFVQYRHLLSDWRGQIQRIARTLEVDLSAARARQVDDFLSPELRHHRCDGPVTDYFGTDWLSSVYASMAAAASDQAWDIGELDRVYDAYGSTEQGFRAAFDGARRYRRVNWLLSPLLIKLGLEALALMNRRKGSWA